MLIADRHNLPALMKRSGIAIGGSALLGFAFRFHSYD
jgi:hypothetical protein